MYVNCIFKYLGIVTLSVFLIIFSLDSIPQTFGGPVPPPNTIESNITIVISCGINISGTADFGLVSFGETVHNSDVTLSNSGTGTAQVSANVGQSLVSSPLAGGYAGTTDQTTQIAPHDITLQINSQGRVPMMDSSANVVVGELPSTDSAILEVGAFINPINPPATDPVWRATFSLTVSGCSVG